MFNYYLGLAVRSLRRNVVLTVLMIAAVGVGIGASMTTLTVFRAMDADPIPQKSSQLYTVQLDNWGPKRRGLGTGDAENLQPQISYQDAMAFMHAHQGVRQSAMYLTGLALIPSNVDLKPEQVITRAAYTDFFGMFQTPFLFGGAWTGEDDENHASVVVLSRELNNKVFGGRNSVGKTLNLDGRDYRITGVLNDWNPLPKFYDLNNDKYEKSAQIYIPFTRAIDGQMASWGNYNCNGDTGPAGWEGHLRSECVWLQFWLELPTRADAERFRHYLDGYAAEQRQNGRFDWSARTRLRDVREWLVYQNAVSQEARILVLVSFSFLLVCLINAMGLMLAKIMGRSADIGVRRALGANRAAIFGQCLMEAGVIGVAGGILGLLLTALGLIGLRSLVSEGVARLTHFNLSDITIAVVLSIAATLLAGLYPTWRAAQVQPAWQLKTQ